MELRDFHCDSLELTAHFAQEDFDNKAFVEDVQPQEGKPFVWSFGSKDKQKSDHAHMSIRFPPEELGRLKLSYHRGASPQPDVRPPYLEDCASWIGKFFKTDEVRFLVVAYYTVEQQSRTALNLPFPWVANNEGLRGATVTGLVLDFPKDAPVEHVHIEREPKDILVSLSRHEDIALKTFDPYAQLEAFNSPLNLLLGEEKTDNG